MLKRNATVPEIVTMGAASEEVQENVSRRQFIRGVVAASVMAAGIGDLSKAAIGAPRFGAASVLTAQESQVLALVLNLLIPQNVLMPGAGDLGVGSFIEQALVSAPHLRPWMANLLAELPDHESLGQMPEAQAYATLRSLERGHHESFGLLIEATYGGYYGHTIIQSILGWRNTVDTGSAQQIDISSLEEVRRRGLRFASTMLSQSYVSARSSKGL